MKRLAGKNAHAVIVQIIVCELPQSDGVEEVGGEFHERRDNEWQQKS